MKSILAAILLAALLVLQAGCAGGAVSVDQAQEPPAVPAVNPISNTTWLSDDGSEVIFTEDRIDWYHDPDNHEDFYYSGAYVFYIGEAAIEYITQDLSDYGITREKLERQFSASDEHDVSNFVVFDIRYDRWVLFGQEQTIERPLVPWYGYILDDDTRLDVANMNTGTYYPFFKVENEAE